MKTLEVDVKPTLEVDVKPTSSDEIEIAPRPSMAGPTPEPRKEALEVKLRAVKAVVAATPKRKSTEKEGRPKRRVGQESSGND